jgi:hypothetical protein
VNPAVIGENASGLERHGEGEPVVTYARIKYSIRIIWKTGRHTMIVGDPNPIDDIAGLDNDPARVEVGPALSHVHIRRRRGSEGWQQDQKQKCQSEIHFESFCGCADLGRRLTRKRVRAIDLG